MYRLILAALAFLPAAASAETFTVTIAARTDPPVPVAPAPSVAPQNVPGTVVPPAPTFQRWQLWDAQGNTWYEWRPIPPQVMPAPAPGVAENPFSYQSTGRFNRGYLPEAIVLSRAGDGCPPAASQLPAGPIEDLIAIFPSGGGCLSELFSGIQARRAQRLAERAGRAARRAVRGSGGAVLVSGSGCP